jgi:hypothetical protein
MPPITPMSTGSNRNFVASKPASYPEIGTRCHSLEATYCPPMM